MPDSASIRQLLIEQLAWEPPCLNASLRDLPKVRSTALTRQPTDALDRLTSLPTEIIHIILSGLSIRSIIQYRKTCLRAHYAVESLYHLNLLREYAPETLALLGNTGLANRWTIPKIAKLLQTDRCVACGNIAPFVFSLDMARCCLPCSRTKSDFWAVDINLAPSLFHIHKEHHLQTLPFVQSTGGARLISYKGAVATARQHERPESTSINEDKLSLVEEPALSLASLLRQQPATQGDKNEAWHAFRRLAIRLLAMPFPSLKAGQVQRWLYCRGCDQSYLTQDSDATTTARRAVFWSTLTAYSENEFLLHVEHCPGSKALEPYVGGQLKAIRKLESSCHVPVSSEKLTREQRLQEVVGQHIEGLEQMILRDMSGTWHQR